MVSPHADPPEPQPQRRAVRRDDRHAQLGFESGELVQRFQIRAADEDGIRVVIPGMPVSRRMRSPISACLS